MNLQGKEPLALRVQIIRFIKMENINTKLVNDLIISVRYENETTKEEREKHLGVVSNLNRRFISFLNDKGLVIESRLSINEFQKLGIRQLLNAFRNNNLQTLEPEVIKHPVLGDTLLTVKSISEIDLGPDQEDELIETLLQAREENVSMVSKKNVVQLDTIQNLSKEYPYFLSITGRREDDGYESIGHMGFAFLQNIPCSQYDIKDPGGRMRALMEGGHGVEVQQKGKSLVFYKWVIDGEKISSGSLKFTYLDEFRFLGKTYFCYGMNFENDSRFSVEELPLVDQ